LIGLMRDCGMNIPSFSRSTIPVSSFFLPAIFDHLLSVPYIASCGPLQKQIMSKNSNIMLNNCTIDGLALNMV
jgi:hypothetical protein